MKKSKKFSVHNQAVMGYPVAATAALLSSSQQADAQVFYSGIQDLPVNQLSATDLDIDADLTGDILLKNYVFGVNNYQGATVNFSPGKVVGFNAGLNYASLLSAGDTIDATTTTGSFAVSLAYGNNPNSQFDSATNGYLGLTFPIAGNNHYAWIRVSIDNAAGSFTIHDWAYELTPDVGIAAGAIPEPANLSLLAAGAVGLAALRKRRRRSA